MIKFRKMTENEYINWLELTILNYAKSLVTSGQYSEIEAAEEAKKGFCLKDGLSTPKLLTAENVDGIPVGVIWHTEDPKCIFILDFLVYDEYRRMGYGHAMLVELERILKEKNIQSVELHVFAYNNAAISLYEKCGFVIAKSDNGSIYMEKVL
jgi:ribosomal protein S18 acetylase RimI-like enzyme